VKASDIERTYQETTFGFDEPEVVYLTGGSLKYFLLKIGDTATKHTTDGHLIVDSGFYCMTRKGIWLVE
jgi:hypothetical protein